MLLVDNTPFSRGILARSLEAAGISPEEARKIAQNIRDELNRNKVYTITRNGLRQLVVVKIQNQYDQKIVDRYLFWSKFRRKEQSLILIIGGSTGSGKSTVATEIAHRLEITRIVSTDIIRSIMRSMLTDQLTPLLHKSSYNAWEELDIPLSENEDKVIWAFREQANQVAVGIQAVIDRALLENISIVIEGVHAVPGLIREKYLNHKKIIMCMLTMPNRTNHKHRFTFREATAVDRPSQKYLKYFEHIRKIQDYVVSLAQTQEIPILSNDDLDKTVTSIIQYITQKIRFYEENESSSTD